MRTHFRCRHINDIVVLAEEGQLPRCDKCGILQRKVDASHQESFDCLKWAKKRNERENDVINKITVANTMFTVNGIPLTQVKEFKYFGRVLANNDNDWPAVNQNIQRARMAWGRLGRILSKENADTRQLFKLCCCMMQQLGYLLLPWSRNKKHFTIDVLGGQHIQQDAEGTWTYPPSHEVLQMANLLPIKQYTIRRKTQ